jgi:hypothetical protein
MTKFFIYILYQQGNVGGHHIEAIREQPDDGFVNEEEAEKHLLELIEKREGWGFDRDWYKFVIMKTYTSKSALDAVFLLKKEIKRIAETHHDREVMACQSGLSKTCPCCKKEEMNFVCIEHDSQDYSKDLWICSKCYVEVATYWKKHSRKKICPL